MADNQKRIFVLMPSYRDPECQWTVKDLFEKAKYPERIFVGICWQYDMQNGEDAECFRISPPLPQNVRVIEFDYRDAKGANWGRAQAAKLWQGEEYVFFTEPHIRFEENWDEILINMHNQCPSKKAVLTAFMPSYTLPNKLGYPYVGSLSLKAFHHNGILLINTHHIPHHLVPQKPFLSSVLVTSCLFAPSEMLEEVPIDPYIYFEGDESSHSARAWTHGWDIYAMNRPLFYHLWNRNARPLHWENLPQKSKTLSDNSARRFWHLFGMANNMPEEALVDIDKYNFGRERTLSEYEKFAGVNFKDKVIHDQSTWIIKHDETKPLPSLPAALQQRKLAELRNWLTECVLLNVDTGHIHKVLKEHGVEDKLAAESYAQVKSLLMEHADEIKYLSELPRLNNENERWIAEQLFTGCLAEDVYSALRKAGWAEEEIINSVLKGIYESPFDINGNIMNRMLSAGRFASFIKQTGGV